MTPRARRPSNKRMNLTVRPVTHLAGVAPPLITPNGVGQGARPSRPAGYPQRSTVKNHKGGSSVGILDGCLR